jgi:RimJ/RimL family protein N-acetyltransferase
MLEPSYPIYTERLFLRPFKDSDLEDLYAYHSLSEVTRFLYWDKRTLDETKKALERKKNEAHLTKEGSTLTLAVIHKETSRVIGEVSLTWHSQEHQQGEIGFVFNPAFQGHGYAAEATGVIFSLGFEELKLHRIYGRCDARNIASYKLMERLGMRREAHFIHNEIFKGEWGDEFVYALLQDDWIATR